ncbi:unnamed protein product [Cyprideis torosa]|uniref:Uncharacterized protein n=1 Tax=Cyprideis torosa TaxID=163714 RepID=A0A7R8ZVB6_9CRUS|nr:unnamed protein product [Cyprideis torosa]CAG0907320.1 unnamed protein product [Cyprideis torosa]
MFLIIAFGVLNIYSVSPSFGQKQLIWVGMAFFMMLLGVIITNGRRNFFEINAPIFYLITVLLLVGLFPLGKEIHGAKAWYSIGGKFSIQPAEFAKIATGLMIANQLSLSENMGRQEPSNFWKIAVILGIPMLLILLQPDLGSFIVFSAFILALFREGLSPWLILLPISLGGIFLSSVVWNPLWVMLCIGYIFTVVLLLIITITPYAAVLSSFVFDKLPKHQKERVMVLFEGEEKYPRTAGYNLLYAKVAIGSGELKGRGWNSGPVTDGGFVPEQHTDYIFSTVGEEWGFLGASFLVLLYTAFIGRLYYLAESQKTVFARYFGNSVASILLIHFFLNVAMVMGLFPTVGIPLPFFSYGGSSLWAFSLLVFIFLKLNYDDKRSMI